MNRSILLTSPIFRSLIRNQKQKIEKKKWWNIFFLRSLISTSTSQEGTFLWHRKPRWMSPLVFLSKKKGAFNSMLILDSSRLAKRNICKAGFRLDGIIRKERLLFWSRGMQSEQYDWFAEFSVAEKLNYIRLFSVRF